MRKLTLALALLLVVFSIPLYAKSAFSGSYTINGFNPGVGAYTGALAIAARGDVYDVYWTIGNVKYSGVGVATGDTLSVAYSDAGKTWLGVMSYRLKANGSLDGKWAVQGRAGAAGTETAVRK